MRKGFDTLARIVEDELGRDPLSGDLYLFINNRRNRAKILLWDGTGLAMYVKRLEKGRFAAPWTRAHEGTVRMSSAELALLLEGSQLVFVGALSPNAVEPQRVATRDLRTR